MEAYRWVFLNESGLPHYKYLLVSLGVGIVIWFGGAIAFRAMENKIAGRDVEMSRFAIKTEHVWKEYQIRHTLEGPQSSFKAVLNAPFNWLMRRSDKYSHLQKLEAFFALKDVSFEVEQGKWVG